MFPFKQIGNWLKRRGQQRIERKQHKDNEAILAEFHTWLFEHPQCWKQVSGRHKLRVVNIGEIMLPEELEDQSYFLYVLNFYDDGGISLIQATPDLTRAFTRDNDYFHTWLGLVPTLMLKATFTRYMEKIS